MENCKNCFLAASCVATKAVDPNATEKHWEDENRRLKEMLCKLIEVGERHPHCEICGNIATLSCDNCTTNHSNFKHKFADEFDEIMARE